MTRSEHIDNLVAELNYHGIIISPDDVTRVLVIGLDSYLQQLGVSFDTTLAYLIITELKQKEIAP